MRRHYARLTGAFIAVAVMMSGACAPSAPAPTAAPAKPTDAAKPADAAKPTAAPKPAEVAKPAESKPAEAAKPTEAPKPAAAKPSQAPFEVVVAIASEPSTLDPHQRNSPVEGLVVNQMFDSLLKEGVNGEVQPGLAESWQVAQDGMSITLKLRRGVTFHDGTPFNAEAIKFNYERQLNKEGEFYGDGTWRLVGLFAGNIKLPIEALDEYTVKINFNSLLAPDINLTSLANTPHAMVSPTAVRASRKEFTNKPVGTGPFKLVSWEKGNRIVLEKNAEYWGTKPEIDRLILIPTQDPDARLAALRSGTADINGDISGDQLEAIRTDSKYTVVQKPTRHIWHVLLNQASVPQLQDKRVRQALNYAVDKEAIVKDILRGSGVVAKGPMSSSFGDYLNQQLPGFPYDQAKAKQLLAEAGFPDGRGFPQLTIRIPTDAALAGKPVVMSEAIQANLAAVGINVSLEPSDFASWFGRVGKGEFQMAVFSLSIGLNDPDNALYSGYHSSRVPPQFHNFGSWKNEEFDRLAEQSRTALDRNERIRIVKRLQEIVAFEDPAAIWIEHAVFAVATNDKVKNVQVGTHASIMPMNEIQRR